MDQDSVAIFNPPSSIFDPLFSILYSLSFLSPPRLGARIVFAGNNGQIHPMDKLRRCSRCFESGIASNTRYLVRAGWSQ